MEEKQGLHLAVRGWINIQPTNKNIRAALADWGALANQKREPIRLTGLSREEVATWARACLQQAQTDEGSNAPNACITSSQEKLILEWMGMWTKGREFRVDLSYKDTATNLTVSWDTGTGQPSRFLNTHKWVTGRDDPQPEGGSSWEQQMQWSIRGDALNWGFLLGDGPHHRREIVIGDKITDHYEEIREALRFNPQVYLFFSDGCSQYNLRVVEETGGDFAGRIYPLGSNNNLCGEIPRKDIVTT